MGERGNYLCLALKCYNKVGKYKLSLFPAFHLSDSYLFCGDFCFCFLTCTDSYCNQLLFTIFDIYFQLRSSISDGTQPVGKNKLPAVFIIDMKGVVFNSNDKIPSCRQTVLYAFYGSICTVSYDKASFCKEL